MYSIHILNLSTRIEWTCLIQIINDWWIVESFSLFIFHSSTKQIWYSSIYWFIEVWWILKMDDYWYNEDKGRWYGEFEMAYECIDKCEYEWNGNQFINKWKEWFYELMNIVFKWCDLKHNRLIVVMYCYLLSMWYI